MKWLVDFVYPKECVGCSLLGEWLCESCRLEFEKVEQVCLECMLVSKMGEVHHGCKKRYGLDGLTAVYEYDEEVMKKLLRKVKFEFNRELLNEFLRLLDFRVGKKFEVVVPVPLYKNRENWRGFNQAGIISLEIGKQLELPVVEVLKRVKKTQQQSGIRKRKDRLRNVKGVFGMVEKSRWKKVLLVDDVFTSGATMREAAGTLKKAGVKEVWGVVLARGGYSI
jgi:ComF family protein